MQRTGDDSRSGSLPCSIVLVRPKIAANLGFVARAMANFGFERLRIVAPQALPDDPRAVRTARGGRYILDSAEIYGTLPQAIAHARTVVGTTARTGGFYRGTISTPREVAARIGSQLSLPLAIVFGPETNGLTNEETACCHELIRIPTQSRHPAMNLSHAVAICLYEFASRLRSTDVCRRTESGASLASFVEQDRMFARLRSALERIHFLYGEKKDTLMYAIRKLIARSQPTSTEVKILIGLARQIEWFAEHAQSGDTPEAKSN